MSDVNESAEGEFPPASPDSLIQELDVDGSGWIESDEFEEQNQIDKELQKIFDRRNGAVRRFPRGIEDYVLISGLLYGLLFFGTMFAMSAGMLGNGVEMDETLSATVLDFDECDDPGNNVWVNAWIDDSHNVRLDAYNVPDEAGFTNIRWKFSDGSNWITEENSTTIKIDFSEWDDSEYELLAEFNNHTSLENSQNYSNTYTTLANKTVKLEVSSSSPSMGWLPWVSNAPVKDAEVLNDGPRACWTTSELGGWSWILMGAEWGGGRETAMLAGGSAGVPPWWMAFISLSMSIFFLFVQYPLMYRFYHREEDDELSDPQLARLIERSVKSCEKKLRIEVDWDSYRYQQRDISIDVLVPYNTTMETFIDSRDIRGEIVTKVLDELKSYGVMKPLHLQANAGDSRQGIFESLRKGLDPSKLEIESGGNYNSLVEDYSKFFESVGTLAGVEDRAIDAIKDWFKDSNLIDRGSKVYSDDLHLYVRVIYKPKQRLAFFRFKQSYVDVEAQLENFMLREMKGHMAERELVVSARNEVGTLADRSAAGRVEVSKGGEHQVLVAKQEGLVGTILQNQVMGDVLSTVEFVAHEKRDFINKWGFWGLIVFVWIPFMASGVLVGAMLGLLSRMKFIRVLIACAIGGFAASITWAYTARGIIEVMEKYHAEALIPWMIAIVVIFALVHLRTSKRRRREALFKETQQFFSGVSETES
ncbi:MAG: small multi-drug export protein [Candidatus Thalassarchaeaceae archaeon]|jgi:hypothetical protein|nr:small multi-drug export protein [Candidatus Thalassarchaeaceae archaeon]